MTDLKQSLILLAISIALFVSGFFSGIGCAGIKIYNEEGVPQPCNDWYTTMGWNKDRKSNSTTLVTLQWQKCTEARKSQRERDCAIWIFPDGKVSDKDHLRYSYWKACIKY